MPESLSFSRERNPRERKSTVRSNGLGLGASFLKKKSCTKRNHFGGCVETQWVSPYASKPFLAKKSLKGKEAGWLRDFESRPPHFIIMAKCKWYDVCPIVRFVEEGRLDRKWIEKYCLVGNKKCIRYQMEEKDEPHPDNLLPDGTYLK